jgi:hypothetical protein
MAVRVANDAFNLTTGPQGTTYTRSFAFAPKFVFATMVGTVATSSGEARSNLKVSWGFANASDQVCWGGYSTDGAVNSASGMHLKSGRVLCEQAGNTILAGELSVTISGNDLIFEVESSTPFSAAYRVLLWVLGGDEIEDAHVGTFVAATSGTTTVTGVGFQGNAVLCGQCFADTDPTVSADLGTGIGWAVGTGAQDAGLLHVRTRPGLPSSDTYRYARNNELLALSLEAAGTMNERHSFTGFTSNGFTLSKVEGAQAGLIVPFAVIKGGRWSLLTANGRNDTTNDITFSGAPSVPRGALLTTVGVAENTLQTHVAHAVMSVGMFDENLNQQSLALFDRDNVPDMVCSTRYSSTEIASWPDTFSNLAPDGAFALQSLTASGAVGRMTDASSNLAFMAMLVVSQSAVEATGRAGFAGAGSPRGSVVAGHEISGRGALGAGLVQVGTVVAGHQLGGTAGQARGEGGFGVVSIPAVIQGPSSSFGVAGLRGGSASIEQEGTAMATRQRFLREAVAAYLNGKTLEMLLLRDLGGSLVDDRDDETVAEILARPQHAEANAAGYQRQALTGVAVEVDNVNDLALIRADKVVFAGMAPDSYAGGVVYVSAGSDADRFVVGMYPFAAAQENRISLEIRWGGVDGNAPLWRTRALAA